MNQDAIQDENKCQLVLMAAHAESITCSLRRPQQQAETWAVLVGLVFCPIPARI